MTTYFRDPTLVELLSDPLTHAVMRADHVNPQKPIVPSGAPTR
jgi:hypothetical protein